MQHGSMGKDVNQAGDPEDFIVRLQTALAAKKTKELKNYTVTAIFVKWTGSDQTGNYRQIIFKMRQDMITQVRNLIARITSKKV
jgi:hypothetical protein